MLLGVGASSSIRSGVVITYNKKAGADQMRSDIEDYTTISVHRNTRARLVKLGLERKPRGFSTSFDKIIIELLDNLEKLRTEKIPLQEIQAQLKDIYTQINEIRRQNEENRAQNPNNINKGDGPDYEQVINGTENNEQEPINEPKLGPSYRSYRNR